MTAILQTRLRFAPWMHPATRRLPGVQPLNWADWLQWDEASAAQIAEKQRLMRDFRDSVTAVRPEARPALAETREVVGAWLDRHRPEHTVAAGEPVEALASTIPEDFALLQKSEAGWVLSAGLVGFPASWSLAEKMGRPMGAIHDPVRPYTSDMARRVDRLFDGLHPDRPVWRANALLYHAPDLFQPNRRTGHGDSPGYLRSERQSLLKLPRTGAVVFSIHTTVVPITALTPDQAHGLKASPIVHAGGG